MAAANKWMIDPKDAVMLLMVQLWVNLPAKDKMSPPRYQEILSRQIPTVPLDGDGSARVIAGDFRGTRGPAKTFTPISVLDLRLTANGRADLPPPDGHTTLAVVLKGRVLLNGTGEAGRADLAVFDRSGDGVTVEAREDAVVLVLSGEPIDEPVVSYGPFVMNTQEEIRQAISDYQSGRMGDGPRANWHVSRPSHLPSRRTCRPCRVAVMTP